LTETFKSSWLYNYYELIEPTLFSHSVILKWPVLPHTWCEIELKFWIEVKYEDIIHMFQDHLQSNKSRKLIIINLHFQLHVKKPYQWDWTWQQITVKLLNYFLRPSKYWQILEVVTQFSRTFNSARHQVIICNDNNNCLCTLR
jgi:hypothetical protein